MSSLYPKLMSPALKRQHFRKQIRSQHHSKIFSTARKALVTQINNQNYQIQSQERQNSDIAKQNSQIIRKSLINIVNGKTDRNILKTLWQALKVNLFLMNLIDTQKINELVEYAMNIVQKNAKEFIQEVSYILLILLNWYGKSEKIDNYERTIEFCLQVLKQNIEPTTNQLAILCLANLASEDKAKKLIICQKKIWAILNAPIFPQCVQDLSLFLTNLLSGMRGLDLSQGLLISQIVRSLWQNSSQQQFNFLKRDLLQIIRILSSPFTITNTSERLIIFKQFHKIIKQIIPIKEQKYFDLQWQIIWNILNLDQQFILQQKTIQNTIIYNAKEWLINNNQNHQYYQQKPKQKQIRHQIWQVLQKITNQQTNNNFNIYQLVNWVIFNVAQQIFDQQNQIYGCIFVSRQQFTKYNEQIIDFVLSQFDKRWDNNQCNTIMLIRILNDIPFCNNKGQIIRERIVALNNLYLGQNEQLKQIIHKILKMDPQKKPQNQNNISQLQYPQLP